MPGWHAATAELQAEGKLQTVGIVEEQHPERARLFMQWKEMGWPILVDSLDLLEVNVVPITLALDEQGIVRILNPMVEKLGQIQEHFLNRTYEAPTTSPPAHHGPADLAELQQATENGSADRWPAYTQELALWAGDERLDEAIEAYQQVLALEPEEGWSHFRLGVLYRRRYDSPYRQAGDFQAAVQSWERALDIDPNNYIWRRRIQQYGPRLDKPYPFYDWVPQARQEIQARGDVPVELTVEPGGAEFAAPASEFKADVESVEEPDPRGRILRDEDDLIQVETTAVPQTVTAGETVRVHVLLRPKQIADAHWNNEVDASLLWITPPNGWQVDTPAVTAPLPPTPTSEEVRTFEVELQSPAEAAPGLHTIPAYALYYVCEGRNGACLYRRQDIGVPIEIR